MRELRFFYLCFTQPLLNQFKNLTFLGHFNFILSDINKPPQLNEMVYLKCEL